MTRQLPPPLSSRTTLGDEASKKPRVYNQNSTMELARIAASLEPFLRTSTDSRSTELSQRQLSSISIYIDLLLKWNAKINLTAVRDPDEIVTRHFGESLFAARHIFPQASVNADVIDIGSGAGFPGLPIKLWAPNIELTLIESNNKKTTFLREVIRLLALRNVEVFTGRAEVFPGTGDVVTLRAVERFQTALQIAVNLVKGEGTISLLIGEDQVTTAKAASQSVRWHAPLPLPNSQKRILLLGARNQGSQSPTT
jgi:16S rRNA (guanine527-N7)-methyltransferase